MCSEFDSYYNHTCTCISGCFLGKISVHWCVFTLRLCDLNRLCVKYMYMGLISCRVRELCLAQILIGFQISLHTYHLSDDLFRQCGVCLIVTQRYIVLTLFCFIPLWLCARVFYK